MTLTLMGYVLLGLFLAWASIAAVIAYVDYRLRQEDRLRLDTRAWDEKVQAMRRLQD
jgi:hypothetical protein